MYSVYMRKKVKDMILFHWYKLMQLYSRVCLILMSPRTFTCSEVKKKAIFNTLNGK